MLPPRRRAEPAARRAFAGDGRRAFAFEPAPHRRDVTAQRVWRVAHVDAERLVDRRMADAESEDETSVGRVRDERCALSAGVGMAHVDVGDPGANLNAPGCRAHELSGRHDIVVDLGREDRIEACLLGFAGDRLDFVCTPADTGNDGESKSFGYASLLSQLRECFGWGASRAAPYHRAGPVCSLRS